MSEVDWLQPENRIRATPLLLLKQGLEKGQWEAITFAYLMLTGDKIVPPTSLVINNQDAVLEPINYQPQQVEPVEEEDLDEEDEQEEEDVVEEDEDEDNFDDDEDDEKVEQRPKGRIYTRKMKVDVKGRRNKFVDDQIFAIEDNAFLPKKQPPPSLHRPQHTLIKVRCHSCGKVEKVDPMLAPKRLDRNYKMRYNCNECSCRGRE